jgi:hypothetical protein
MAFYSKIGPNFHKNRNLPCFYLLKTWQSVILQLDTSGKYINLTKLMDWLRFRLLPTAKDELSAHFDVKMSIFDTEKSENGNKSL